MLKSRFFQIFLLLIAAGAIFVLAFKPGQIRLVELPVPPRDAPEAMSGDKELALAGLDDRRLLEGAELRKARNSLVGAWQRALDEYSAGRGSLREAELIEFKIWTTRWQVGEITERAMHAGIAELLERELDRLEQLARFDPPQASASRLRAARVFLARERLLAGLSDHGYAARREAQLTALKDRVHFLQKQRPAEVQSALDELDDFEAECPPERELLERLDRS